MLKMNKNDVVILFFPSDVCNFSCKYCYRTPFRENKYIASIEDIDAMTKNISKLHISTFKVLGGEPLVYPNLEYLLDSLQKNNNISDLKVLTNGYLTDKLEYLADKYKNVYFRYSIHISQSNLSENNIKQLLKPNIKFRILCDFTHQDKIDYYVKLLKSYNLDFGLIDIQINNHVDNEFSTKKQFDKLYKNVFGKENEYPSYKGCHCYNNIIRIHPNGVIRYDTCHSDTTLLTKSIYEQPYYHLPRKIICNMDSKCYFLCNNNYKEIK